RSRDPGACHRSPMGRDHASGSPAGPPRAVDPPIRLTPGLRAAAATGLDSRATDLLQGGRPWQEGSDARGRAGRRLSRWPAALEGRWPFSFSLTAKEGIMPDREVLIQRLIELNEEFRRLRDEHQTHDRDLAALQARPFLTPEQEWRVHELKKLKLI